MAAGFIAFEQDVGVLPTPRASDRVVLFAWEGDESAPIALDACFVLGADLQGETATCRPSSTTGRTLEVVGHCFDPIAGKLVAYAEIAGQATPLLSRDIPPRGTAIPVLPIGLGLRVDVIPVGAPYLSGRRALDPDRATGQIRLFGHGSAFGTVRAEDGGGTLANVSLRISFGFGAASCWGADIGSGPSGEWRFDGLPDEGGSFAYVLPGTLEARALVDAVGNGRHTELRVPLRQVRISVRGTQGPGLRGREGAAAGVVLFASSSSPRRRWSQFPLLLDGTVLVPIDPSDTYDVFIPREDVPHDAAPLLFARESLDLRSGLDATLELGRSIRIDPRCEVELGDGVVELDWRGVPFRAVQDGRSWIVHGMPAGMLTVSARLRSDAGDMYEGRADVKADGGDQIRAVEVPMSRVEQEPGRRPR